MSVLDFTPAFALVAILGGFRAWAWNQNRRLRQAVQEAASRMKGRYEPGGRFSGGILRVTCDGRDVTFVFNLSHSRRSESTDVVAGLTRVLAGELVLKGRRAVDRAPRLARYDGLFFPVVLDARSNLVTVRVYGVVRRSDRLVDLAQTVAALAGELEKL